MKVLIEKQDTNNARINLEIPADYAMQEYNKACKRLSQRVNIPGFRRGKAPRNIVEKAIGIDRIKQEALERILPNVFADAISEHQLDIVAPPRVEKFNFDLTAGIQVDAMVELRPDVKIGDVAGDTIDVPQFKLSADAEEKELKQLMERFTALQPVLDRAAKADDILNIDFTGFVNGELIRGGAAKNYRIDLANNNFIEGFAEQLVGHKLREEFSINVTFPENYHDSGLAAKPAEFRIKINDIQQRVVPEMNDAFAQKVGPYETLDALKVSIREVLDAYVDMENKMRKQQALVERMVAKAEVDVPLSMVAREARILMGEVQQKFKDEGHSWEQFVATEGQEKVMANLSEEATKRIKTSLVFGAIAKQENVKVSEEEFAGFVREMAEFRKVDEKVIMRQLAHNIESSQALTDQILCQKIVEATMDKVTFNLVDEPEPTEPAAIEQALAEKPLAAKPTVDTHHVADPADAPVAVAEAAAESPAADTAEAAGEEEYEVISET